MTPPSSSSAIKARARDLLLWISLLSSTANALETPFTSPHPPILSSNISDILNLTHTALYIIVSPQNPRKFLIESFITSLDLPPTSYVLYPAVDRHTLTDSFLTHLKRQKYFTEEWEIRYIKSVHDPKSREKNLGRLALIITLHSIFNHFTRYRVGDEHLLIFEDDVMISERYQHNKSKFLDSFSQYLLLTPSLWDIQYLGFCFECGNYTSYQEESFSILSSQLQYPLELQSPTLPPVIAVKAVFPLCKHAILLNRHFIKTYLNHYRPLQNNKGDWIFHQIICQHNLKILRPQYSLFTQNLTTTESMLGNNNDKREFALYVSCERESNLCQEMRQTQLDRERNHTSTGNN